MGFSSDFGYFLRPINTQHIPAPCHNITDPSAFTYREAHGEPGTLVNFDHNIGTILLALGANTPSSWGVPRETLTRALGELEAAGLKTERLSYFYKTAPVGDGRQPPYLNAVMLARGGIAPGRLLRLLKQIERRAGRRPRPPLQPRPLDIDVLSHSGRRLNWPALRRERGRLVLPHPLLHTRAFVLVPLLEVAPHWFHPALRRPAKMLMARLGPRARSGVCRNEEPPVLPKV
jgi:2-amino-4-hydroxy-6-hydroxymethyldihydropteridine diphosphokinase